MATRRQVRDAFYDELVTAATQTHTVTYGDGSTDTITVDASNVDLISPNDVEERPAVMYDDNYTQRFFNGVGNGPHFVVRDVNGDVTKHVYREYMRASFTVRLEADSEIEKEPIYEALRRQFGQYQYGFADSRTLHPDITDISVIDASSSDYTDEEVAIRADTFTVEFEWHRDYDETGTVISTVDLTLDEDKDDGNAGQNYTIQ